MTANQDSLAALVRLPKGVRVRLKNKGSKKRLGHPRQKYQVPVPVPPETAHEVTPQAIDC